MAQDIYATVTNRIIEELEKGVVPWRRPWNPDLCLGPDAPVNAVTGHYYSGINNLILGMHPATFTTGDPRFCTYKQAQEKGWQIRKGEKATPIVFYKPWEVDNEKYDPTKEDSPATRMIGLLRTFSVFHVGTQADGAPPYTPPTVEQAPWRRPEAVQTIVDSSGVVLRIGGDRAFYSTLGDFIQMPPDSAFERGAQYFSAVLLHEMGHWSGAQHRLGRDLTGARGSAKYATEEDIVDIAAAMSCGTLGLPVDYGNHASYASHYLPALKEDKKLIFKIAAEAQKVSTFLLNFHPDYRRAHEPEASPQIPRPVASLSHSPAA